MLSPTLQKINYNNIQYTTFEGVKLKTRLTPIQVKLR